MTNSSTTTSALPSKPHNFALGALASVLAIPSTVILAIIIGQFGFEYAGILGGLGMVFAFDDFGSASRRHTTRGFGFACAVGGKSGILGDLFSPAAVSVSIAIVLLIKYLKTAITAVAMGQRLGYLLVSFVSPILKPL